MAGQCQGMTQDHAGQKLEGGSAGQKCAEQDSEERRGLYWTVDLQDDDECQKYWWFTFNH